jgi:malonyl-CoA decarboxylase
VDDEESGDALRQPLLEAAARYFLHARDRAGKPVDPVARFHLGNGARLERINFLGDRSARALRQAHGLMVNYRYKLDDIEANHEAFAGRGEVVAAPAVRRLVRAPRQQRGNGTPIADKTHPRKGGEDETMEEFSR